MRSAVFNKCMIIVQVDERLEGSVGGCFGLISLFSFAVLGFMVRLNERVE